MSNCDCTAGLTATRLRELLHYEPATGVFTRRTARGGSSVGAEAGGKDAKGYVEITIDLRRYKAHRLAWLYVHGVMPSKDVDHKNRKKDDNRIDNLREASPELNGLNMVAGRRNNALGLLGVHQVGDKFVAQIAIGIRKKKNLGKFNTAEEASAAYWRAKAERDATAVIA